jgi:hypothetical protein
VFSTFTLSLCIHNKKGSFPGNTTQHLGDASTPGHWAPGAEEIQRVCFCISNRKESFPGNTTQHLGTAQCLVTGPLVPKKYGEHFSTSATEKNPFLETPPNIWGQLDAWSQAPIVPKRYKDHLSLYLARRSRYGHLLVSSAQWLPKHYLSLYLTRRSRYGHSLVSSARWLPNETFYCRDPVRDLVPLMVTGGGFRQGESMNLRSLA